MDNNYLSTRPQLRGTLMVTVSGVCFGLIGFLGTKLFNFNFTIVTMLFWRFLIATIWMVVSALITRPTISISKIETRLLLKIFIFGAMSYSAASVFYFLACQYIGTGLAMVVFFSFPVFVTLFAWLFDDLKMNSFTVISLTAVIIGLSLLKLNGQNQINTTGTLLALVAALSFATYIYGSKSTTKTIDAKLLTLLVCFGNALVFLALALYSHSFLMPKTLEAWIYVAALGIIATALPIQLLLSGLKYISPVKASILSALEPIVTVCVGLAVLNEAITLIQVIGIGIILFGAIFIQFERPRSPVQI